jgi:histidine ammonia-lyase
MLLCRARTLAQGHSGVRSEIVRFLLALLAHDIIPAVPSQGSVGASGDLAPFAHLALPIIGEGEILVDGTAVPSACSTAPRACSPTAVSRSTRQSSSLTRRTRPLL